MNSLTPKHRVWHQTLRSVLNSKGILVVCLKWRPSRIDRLFTVLRVPLKNFSLIWRRCHCRWRAAKFSPMLGVQGLWAGKDLSRTTPAVTRVFGFSGLIQRTAPFNRLLQHTRGSGRPIFIRILTEYDHFRHHLEFFETLNIGPGSSGGFWKWTLVY
jgi:hypothetical protein